MEVVGLKVYLGDNKTDICEIEELNDEKVWVSTPGGIKIDFSKSFIEEKILSGQWEIAEDKLQAEVL